MKMLKISTVLAKTFLAGALLMPHLASAAPSAGSNPLAQIMAKTVSKQPGHFAVYAARSGQAPDVCLNCDDLINAASTMKLFVLDTAYEAFTKGTLHPEDTIVVHNHFHSLVGKGSFALEQKEDSYDPLYAQAGKPVPVSELLRVMIQYSSNLATNLMIEKLGVLPIRSVVKAQGLIGIVFGRMIEDFDANDQGIRNQVSARGLGDFLQKLDSGKIVGKAQSQSMIQIMLGQKFNDIIPPGLPASTPVAHKTGWVDGVRNDAAIVTLPDGKRYILVVLTSGLPDEQAGIRVLNTLSHQAYEYFLK
ncbi:beta-lactamase [Acetobacter malorum DSM 14337]|uniref:beta-lactamase n=2 Tax=Acetobacter TaxID=434 RepID=A0A149QG98_9PROT|nr:MULTISPECIES: serine hydrolase [Acetobacter]KXU96325.1 beta-lactamase [Acetobacter cerevisiae]KXV05086.1 beta-lactamase [Acetobacter malorum]GBQ05715.1 beta-lactamase [Acetobacter cerevisiae DSM 14362]GBQ78540.1 beta-lactamase [Acetobacter malorum DSM 14337]